MAEKQRYRAFISYSHADAKAAAWLQRALETYRIPDNVAGTTTARGKVPHRLNPVFRDRSELAASHSLSEELQAALARSDALIVICSQASAKSKYVAAEIEQFRKLHDNPNILALLVDGEPGDPEREPFPEPLRGDEPIAADLRPEGDGKRGALLKVIAGLTGVGLDDLIQRDAQRRATRMRWIAAAATVLAVIMAGLSIIAIQARNLAEQRQEQAEGLVEYMLTDLREQLEPVGRLEVMDGVGERALAYYAEQKLSRLSPEALGRRSRALHLIGEVSMRRGDLDSALAAFQQAAASTEELVEREPNNGDLIFDHAQGVFWVGYVAQLRAQVDEARLAMEEYARLADRLVEIDPTNDDWQLEVAYANTNVGVLALDDQSLDTALTYFTKARSAYEDQVRQHPDDFARAYGLSQSQAYVSDTEKSRGMLSSAMTEREAERATLNSILRNDPENSTALQSLVVNYTSSAQIALAAGKIDRAADEVRKARQTAESLVERDADNMLWRELYIRSLALDADLKSIRREENALALAQTAFSEAQRLLELDNSNAQIARTTVTQAQTVLASIHIREGRPSQAVELLDPIIDRFTENDDLSYRERHLGEAAFLKAVALANIGSNKAAVHFEQANRILDSDAIKTDLTAKSIKASALQRLGRTEEASVLWAEVKSSEYRHPFYYQPTN